MQSSEKSLRIWQAPGHDIKIEFRESVLEALRITALKQLATGAASINGKRGELFGTREGATIHPNCAGLLSTPSNLEPGNSVVGWYAVRTAKEIFLSDEDVKHLNRSTGAPGEVALIVRPGGDESIRIGVFFREANGQIRSSSSYGELLVKVSAPVAPPAPPKLVPASRTVSAKLALEPRTVVPIDTPNPIPPASANRRVPLAVGSIVAAIFVMITFIEIRALNKNHKRQMQPNSRPAEQTQPSNDHAVRVSRAKLGTSGER